MNAQRAHGLQPLQGADQFGGAAACRSRAEPVQERAVAALRHIGQPFEACVGVRVQAAAEPSPESRVHALTHADDQALQHRDAGEENLPGQHPGDGPFEEHAGPLGARPAQGVEPTGESKTGGRPGGKLAVAAAAADLRPVFPAVVARSVKAQVHGGSKEAELTGEVIHDAGRGLAHFIQERAQEAGRAELHGKAEPVVIAAAGGDEFMVGVVEMEEAVEFRRRGFTRVAAVALALFGDEKLDGHGPSFASPSGEDQVVGAFWRAANRHVHHAGSLENDHF